MLVAVQLEPAPIVPAQVCTPLVRLVIVPPFTPPDPVTVEPSIGSEPTTPLLTDVAEGIASPAVKLSVAVNALPGVVTAKFVSTTAGTPAVKLVSVKLPMALAVVVPETVVLGVTLEPETVRVVPTLFADE